VPDRFVVIDVMAVASAVMVTVFDVSVLTVGVAFETMVVIVGV